MTDIQKSAARLVAGEGKPYDLVMVQNEVRDLRSILEQDELLSDDLRDKYKARAKHYEALLENLKEHE